MRRPERPDSRPRRSAPVGYNHGARRAIPTMTVTRRLLVSGRVQRVGFRAFAAGAARREGVRGFVRNLADGRVEAVGEGDREAMDRFERALHRGPRLSRVLGITVEDVAPLDATGGFVVRT